MALIAGLLAAFFAKKSSSLGKKVDDLEGKLEKKEKEIEFTARYYDEKNKIEKDIRDSGDDNLTEWLRKGEGEGD